MPRRMFAGANTAHGFFSFYHQIVPVQQAEKIYVLKGGPGVGKSTLMKRMARAWEEAGAEVEYFHCSGDPASLDAVAVPSAGLAMLDGTAPHIVDPQIPGAVCTLVNLGAFLDESALSKRKSAIVPLSRAASPHYARAYRYLHAAESLREDTALCLKNHVNEPELKRQMISWQAALPQGDSSGLSGEVRTLFAGAITAGQCMDFLDTLSPSQVWRIRGRWGFPTEDLLSFWAQHSRLQGVKTLHLCCPLNPERIEHLYFPDSGLLITTDNCFHSLSRASQREMEIDDLLSLDYASREALSFNRREFDRLLEAACDEIQKARSLHNELEAEYTPCMDFSAAERLCEKIRDESLSILGRLRYDKEEGPQGSVSADSLKA